MNCYHLFWFNNCNTISALVFGNDRNDARQRFGETFKVPDPNNIQMIKKFPSSYIIRTEFNYHIKLNAVIFTLANNDDYIIFTNEEPCNIVNIFNNYFPEHINEIKNIKFSDDLIIF